MATLDRVAVLLGAVLVACGTAQEATVPTPSPPTAAATTEPPPTVPPVTRPPITAVSECSPVPDSVGPPEPGSRESLGPVVLFVEEGVGESNRTRVLDGIRAAEEYVRQSLGGFRFDEPICFDVRASAVEGTTSGTTLGGLYGANHIVIYTGAAPLANAPGWVLSHVAAHEYIHFWQQDVGSPRDSAGPAWLSEGAAEVLGAHALVAAGLASADQIRTSALRRLPADAPELESMERRWISAEEFSYALCFLAAELLTDGPGPASFRDYWRSLAGGVEWEEAFTRAFGVSPGDFYARFEEHRRRGFPE